MLRKKKEAAANKTVKFDLERSVRIKLAKVFGYNWRPLCERNIHHFCYMCWETPCILGICWGKGTWSRSLPIEPTKSAVTSTCSAWCAWESLFACPPPPHRIDAMIYGCDSIHRPDEWCSTDGHIVEIGVECGLLCLYNRVWRAITRCMWSLTQGFAASPRTDSPLILTCRSRSGGGQAGAPSADKSRRQ